MGSPLVSNTFKLEISSTGDRNHFISDVAPVRLAFDQRAAVHASAENPEVFDVVSPHQGIMKMAVSEILIFLKRVRLGRVVAGFCPGDGGFVVQKESNIALEM